MRKCFLIAMMLGISTLAISPQESAYKKCLREE